MAIKGENKISTRRLSVGTDKKDNVEIVTDEIDHSKFSVIRSGKEYDVSKEIKSWEELKEEIPTRQGIYDAIKQLPWNNALPLLQELLQKFEAQQAHDIELIEWLKTLLLVHTAYFMTLPEVVDRLSSLHHVLGGQTALYPKLISMRGRLGLVQKQIEYRNRLEDESDDEEDVMVYSESEEEDIDDENDTNDDEEEGEDNTDLMDTDNIETPMFAEEEEEYLNTEDEDDMSDSDLEE